MLLSLLIRDIVLIEKVELHWSKGLSTLTGETGAGKSILLDALGLAIGARGDAGLVRQSCAQGSVTAEFLVNDRADILTLLNDHGLPTWDDPDRIVLRRVQSADGKSKAFVNDTPVSVNVLGQFGQSLVEIHGQNDNLSLNDAMEQLRLLDQFGGHHKLRDDVFQAFCVLEKARNALEQHKERVSTGAQELEFLKFSIAELEKLDPKPGEVAALEERRSLLQNAGKLTGDIETALQILTDDGGVEVALGRAIRHVERANTLSNGLLSDAASGFERARVELSEAMSELSIAAQKVSSDPGVLEKLEDRLFAMRDLARRHACGADELPNTLATLKEKQAAIDDDPMVLKKLEAEYAQADKDYNQIASDLSKARLDAAQRLDDAVNAELKPLKLENARFRCDLKQLNEPSRLGLERVQFLVRTNPGTPEGVLSKIASGGELSRLMLAIKAVLSNSVEAKTLIFDEVDAGVGGAVAEAVGLRLNALACDHQILVVTHSPQVAARGDTQWQVKKTSFEDDSRTRVDVLNGDERLEEIARMLSGASVTDEARSAARRLLEPLS